MENLILNIVQNYFIVGIVLSVFIDIAVRIIKASTPFTFIEIFAVILAWPVVVATLLTKFINADL
jgi:hypothetical protein